MKPNFTDLGGAAAWGDFAEMSEPMLGNLYAVSIRLPTALKRLFPTGGPVISMMCSDVAFPDEAIMLDKVPTKLLENYDIAVGKSRGELGLIFKEQVGAPIISLFYAWHKLIVDARNGGIGFPNDYKTEMWVAALTGDGVPYYWWGFKRSFPIQRGKPDFGFEKKVHTNVTIPFSYLEMIDIAEKMTGEGGRMVTSLNSAAALVGV